MKPALLVPFSGLALALFASPTPAQSVLATLSGDAAEAFGASVAFVGDLDGDGFDDVAVGSPQAVLGNEARGRVEVFSGRTREVLHTFWGDAEADELGSSVAGAGDVNHDGTNDVVAGAFGGSYARVWSGADGSELHTFTSTGATDFFGFAVAAAGDVDGDLYGDVVVGSDRFALFNPGFAQVFSGRTGGVLHTFPGDQAFDGFGNAVAGGGDANGDGVPDVVVGGPKVDVVGPDSGRARVYSGLDGTVLHTFDGDAGEERFGSAVAFVEDVNGDGRDEIAVGAPVCEANFLCAPLRGYVRVFDGKSGLELYTLRGQKPYGLFGIALAGAGDVDGDGRGDLAIGESTSDGRLAADTGTVWVVSGFDGATLYRVAGGTAGDRLGTAVAACGDLNGDGLSDLLAGSEGGFGRAHSVALGRVGTKVSLATGGEQELVLAAGPSLAGAPVALMGSFLGTEPGLGTAAGVLPLNLGLFGPVDGAIVTQLAFRSLRVGSSYPLAALVNPTDSPAIAVRVGRLDARGEARFTLAIAPGDAPGLAGLTVHHAYLVLDQVSKTAALASNAVALELLP